MSTGGKLAITVGIASSALLAAWLLTGSRKVTTRNFVVRKAGNFRKVLKAERAIIEEDRTCYV